MRRFLMVLLLLGPLAAASASDGVAGTSRGAAAATAQTGRVVKVLPLYLDLKGRDAISPSLFDRDAYQAISAPKHKREFPPSASMFCGRRRARKARH